MNLLRGSSLLLMLTMCACAPQPQPVDNEETAAPSVADDVPASLLVVGTEPFWSVRIDGDELAYTTPETMDAPRKLQGVRRIDADGLHVSGQDGGRRSRSMCGASRVRMGCRTSTIPTWPTSSSAPAR